MFVAARVDPEQPTKGKYMKKIAVIFAVICASGTVFGADVASTIATQGAKTAVAGTPKGDKTSSGIGGAGCLPVGKGALCAGGAVSDKSISTVGAGAGVRVAPNAGVGIGAAQNRQTGEKSVGVGVQVNFGGGSKK